MLKAAKWIQSTSYDPLLTSLSDYSVYKYMYTRQQTQGIYDCEVTTNNACMCTQCFTLINTVCCVANLLHHKDQCLKHTKK